MNSGAQVANEEMFRRELLAKLDRIIELLEKNQAVEHTLALDAAESPVTEKHFKALQYLYSVQGKLPRK